MTIGHRFTLLTFLGVKIKKTNADRRFCGGFCMKLHHRLIKLHFHWCSLSQIIMMTMIITLYDSAVQNKDTNNGYSSY